MRIMAILVVLLIPLSTANASFKEVVETVRQSVVIVSAKYKEEKQELSILEKYLKPENTEKKEKSGFGTGFIIEGGYIVTNNHVIDNAKSIIINFEEDFSDYEAEIIGTDPTTDIAVLRLKDTKKLIGSPVLKFSEEELWPGQDVWAIGHPMGFMYSVSKGVISNLQRLMTNPFQWLIQTDTAVNKGNSGGPLLDMDGNIIAVNTLIISPSGGSIGLSFSVKSTLVQYIAKELIAHGEIKRPIMGIVMKFDQATYNVLADEIGKDSPAEAAGLKPNDIMVSIDGNDINTVSNIFEVLMFKKPNDEIIIGYIRDGVKGYATITLGEKPPEPVKIEGK